MNENKIVERAMSIEGATFPQEVRFLYRLALQTIPDTQFVELGTYQGRTLLALSYAATYFHNHVVSIDNYQYEEKGAKPSSLQTVHENLTLIDASLQDWFTLVEGDTRIVPALIKEVGLLFVDSTHTKEHFDAEMGVWLDYLVPRGIVVCHDYNSPRWLEMTGAIDGWFRNKNYKYLGAERRMIGFRKV